MRTLSATNTTEVAKTITRPFFLVELGFDTTVRLSSRASVVWDGYTWTAASFEWTGSDLVVFNETGSFGQIVLAQGTAGRTLKVWKLYGDGPTWAVADGEILLDGEMGAALIDEQVTINAKARPPQRTPRLYILPPVFNHLPANGTVIKTPSGNYTLERS